MAKRIQLKKTDRNYNGISGLRNKILSNLGDDIFSHRTKQELLFNILQQISPVYKGLVSNDESIERACEKVVAYFYRNDLRRKKEKLIDNTKVFCEDICGIDKIPAFIYEDLLKKVDKDLKSISDLIKWYETQRCIKSYLKKNETPNNHFDTIIYNFYKRCLVERNNIQNYKVTGIKARAIDKAHYMDNCGLSSAFITEAYYDRPYHYSRPNAIRYFDSRKIDLVGHRIDEFYLDELKGLRILYYSDKTKFYKKYFVKKTIENHFLDYKYYLTHLPLQKDRQVIFDELHKLYKKKLWIGLYALALPQVEGIFSEMCFSALPNTDFNRASLTRKVNSVRPYHSLSQSYFDYYEYHIPLQRNRFSHTGYDDNDFRLMSYDLISDLLHVLKIFYQLNHPLVKIKRLHTDMKSEEFITISDFSNYFLLLNALDQKQKQTQKSKIDKFESTFLSKGNVAAACHQMMQMLPQKLSDIIQIINNSLGVHHEPIEIEKIILPAVQTMLLNEREKDIIENCFFQKSTEFDELLSYYRFLGFYKAYLPSLDKKLKNELNEFHQLYKKNLKLICEIGKPLLNIADETYFLQTINNDVINYKEPL